MNANSNCAGGKTSSPVLTLAVFILKFDQIPLTTPPPRQDPPQKIQYALAFFRKNEIVTNCFKSGRVNNNTD